MQRSLLPAMAREIKNGQVTIKVQQPEVLRMEQSFEGMYPVKELLVRKISWMKASKSISPETALWCWGMSEALRPVGKRFCCLLDVYIDGKKTEQVRMPSIISFVNTTSIINTCCRTGPQTGDQMGEP
jgi:hypothetical protein